MINSLYMYFFSFPPHGFIFNHMQSEFVFDSFRCQLDFTYVYLY